MERWKTERAATVVVHVDVIVTGNVKHFVPRRGALGIAVKSPRQFVDAMRS